MNKQVFRKESIERVSSPEQLNEYIRVSNPGVWLILFAIIVLLVGVCVWGVMGHLDTTVSTVCVGEDGTMSLYVKESNISSIEKGMKVVIAEKEYVIENISSEPVVAGETFSAYALHVGNIQSGEWVYVVTVSGEFADGIHQADIIVDSVSPMSFVLN